MAIIPGEFEKNVVIDTPQRQKAKKLKLAFIGVVILITGVIYFGFFSGSGGLVPAALPEQMLNAGATEQINQNDKLLESLSRATLDNPILKDKKFQSLISSDRLPVVIGEKGREDPFLPF